MMAFRAGLLILVVAIASMAMVAQSKEYINIGVVAEPDGHGLVANALEFEDEFMMESESARRLLGGGRGYVSYGALGRNNVPCNQRGRSYYNCRGHQKANPYTRGCTRASRCARNNH